MGGSDDPCSERGTGLVGDRPHRYAQGLRRAGAAGAGDAQAQSAQRPSVRVSWPAWRADQSAMARRPGHVSVRKAAGARPFHLAIDQCERWRGSYGDDYIGTIGVFAGRDRLASAAAHVASCSCGLINTNIFITHLCDSQATHFVIAITGMAAVTDSLPTDLAAAHAMIVETRAALVAAQARASVLESEAKHRALLIEKLKYTIAKLRHEKFGQSSERGALLEQLELRLAELEEDASQAQTVAQLAAAEAKMAVRSFERSKPARRPLPEHLPRERIVYPAPASCPCCGGLLHKIGEDVTETLELVPRHWKVIQHVREKFSCRSCESITQPPAPSHPIARGRAGPGLLAQVLFSKYCLHLPLTRQSTAYAWEGVELEVSTLADWVGACAATLMPMVEAIRTHVFAAERIHADDTTVPVLAKGTT